MSVRYRYLRLRDSIRHQVSRRTWARRAYNFAVRLHGEPDKFVRIDSPSIRVLVPKNRWEPDLYNVQLVGSGPAKIVGDLTRNRLEIEDLSPAVFYFDNNARDWYLDSVHGGIVEK